MNGAPVPAPPGRNRHREDSACSIRHFSGAISKRRPARLAARGVTLDTRPARRLEEERREVQGRTEALRKERNTRSKSIGRAKAAGEDTGPLLADVEKLGDALKSAESRLSELQAELEGIALEIPNLTHESVPRGESEDDNREERRIGEPPRFDFEPKDHTDLGAALGGIDFDLAAKLAGSRFVTLHGALARLHRALIQFMLDVHTREHGYREIYVPYLVTSAALRGTGQLPKFADDQFRIEGSDLYMIPTAEVPVTNVVRDRILDAAELPLRFTCHTPCFRREAGSYGKDTRGMLRQHQFEKVELVHVVRPEDSYRALETLTAHAESILSRLGLPLPGGHPVPPGTSASPPRRPTTSKPGCRGSSATARSPRAATARRSRRGA